MRFTGPLSVYLRAAARSPAKDLASSMLAYLVAGESKLLVTFLEASGANFNPSAWTVTSIDGPGTGTVTLDNPDEACTFA